MTDHRFSFFGQWYTKSDADGLFSKTIWFSYCYYWYLITSWFQRHFCYLLFQTIISLHTCKSKNKCGILTLTSTLSWSFHSNFHPLSHVLMCSNLCVLNIFSLLFYLPKASKRKKNNYHYFYIQALKNIVGKLNTHIHLSWNKQNLSLWSYVLSMQH